MAFAQVTNATVVTVAGRLPSAARRLDTGEWVLGLSDAPTVLVEACGWFPVVAADRPTDTATTTYDRTIELVGDPAVPAVVWTERPKTQAELDADAARAAIDVRTTDLKAAVSTLRAWADDADTTTVTSGNTVATLQVVADRLGVFFDRFADLLENDGYGGN